MLMISWLEVMLVVEGSQEEPEAAQKLSPRERQAPGSLVQRVWVAGMRLSMPSQESMRVPAGWEGRQFTSRPVG